MEQTHNSVYLLFNYVLQAEAINIFSSSAKTGEGWAEVVL
jgi:hypothetical protein